MQRVARHRREGFWTGIAVLCGMRGRHRIIALVCVAVVLQIARNWLLLNWSGVNASVFDSTALLIGLAVIGLFPIGPSVGAATVVLILGTNGVAAEAAAGALLTATAAARRTLLRKLGAGGSALDASRAGALPRYSRFQPPRRRDAATASRGGRAPAAQP